MPDDVESAQQRLAISRRALLEQLRGAPPSPRRRAPLHLAPEQAAWLAAARRVGERWWRRHPANALGQVARPLLARYAREQPAKLLAFAAAGGALAMLLRPWRLLSVGAIAAVLLKSSDVADLVVTLMHKGSSPAREAGKP